MASKKSSWNNRIISSVDKRFRIPSFESWIKFERIKEMQNREMKGDPCDDSLHFNSGMTVSLVAVWLPISIVMHMYISCLTHIYTLHFSYNTTRPRKPSRTSDSHNSMSDPTLSEIYFKNKMTLVWTTLKRNFESFLGDHFLLKENLMRQLLWKLAGY